MNNRLLEIVKYKTGGRQTEFAELMGWTPQYLAKLIRGENFGIKPVITLLSALPEINARWFLLGEGDMIEGRKYTDIRKTMLETMLSVLDLEKFMPVMTPEELYDYEQVIKGNMKPCFSPALLEKWRMRLRLREEETNARFEDAAHKSDIKCRQPKVNK